MERVEDGEWKVDENEVVWRQSFVPAVIKEKYVLGHAVGAAPIERPVAAI